MSEREVTVRAETARDLSVLPMTAWGRHELEVEVRRLQAQNAKLESELSGVTIALPSRGMWEATPAKLAAAYAQRVTELEASIKELERTGGPCSECSGKGKHRLGVGACDLCEGSGHRARQIKVLIDLFLRTSVACEEAKRKADDHLRQRDAARAELELRKPLPSKHKR